MEETKNVICRGLKFRDAFTFCKVLDKIGIKEILDVFSDDQVVDMVRNREGAREIGMVSGVKMGGLVIKNLMNAHDEICDFLAGCLETENGDRLTPDDIDEMGWAEITRAIKSIFTSEDMNDFFGEVAGLLGMGQQSSAKQSSGGTRGQKRTSTKR